ncbi:MAG: Gfo/Idh/MocA family oxidoreductase [Planctomycetaceae bacterium]|nr:Gfo/Idh/MocA family oxidoreductase [Planctomycetaceae bacterium]
MPQRREFLKRTSATIAALSVLPFTQSTVKAQAVSDRLRIACVGVGGRGSGVSGLAARHGDVIMICDADTRHGEAFKNQIRATNATVVQDYRRVIDNKDVDVVIQCAPDHWHTLVNVEALRAGKDVFGEKPITLTIDEGKLLCKTVADTKRIFQTGTQQRCDNFFQTAIELVRNGRLGKLTAVYVAVPFFTTKGGPYPPEEVPPQINWDLYQGQAPLAPFSRHRINGVWRWWYDYAGGIVTDWGNHHVDIAQWGINQENSGPVSVESRALFPNEGRADCYNTPDRFFSRMVYADGLEVLYSAAMGDRATYGAVDAHVETTPEQLDWMFGKDCPDEVRNNNRNGIMFVGEHGRVFVNRGGVYGKPFEELAENPLPENAWRAPHRAPLDTRTDDTQALMENFFECIRSRKEPVASAAIEHRSITLCHLTNISLRLGGRKLTWDPVAEEIVGDAEAKAMQGRKQREPYTIS